MKRTLVAVGAALLALSLPVSSQTERGAPTVARPQGSPRAPDGPRYPAHYIVVEASADGPMRVVHYQRVTLSGPPESLSDTELATRARSLHGRQIHTASVRLVDASGRVRTRAWPGSPLAAC